LIDLVDIVEGSQKQVLLLYLNKNTFGDGDDCVAKVVESVSEKKIEIILVHEQDVEKDACPNLSIEHFSLNYPLVTLFSDSV